MFEQETTSVSQFMIMHNNVQKWKERNLGYSVLLKAEVVIQRYSINRLYGENSPNSQENLPKSPFKKVTGLHHRCFLLGFTKHLQATVSVSRKTNTFNPLIPGGNKRATHAYKNLQQNIFFSEVDFYGAKLSNIKRLHATDHK